MTITNYELNPEKRREIGLEIIHNLGEFGNYMEMFSLILDYQGINPVYKKSSRIFEIWHPGSKSNPPEIKFKTEGFKKYLMQNLVPSASFETIEYRVTNQVRLSRNLLENIIRPKILKHIYDGYLVKSLFFWTASDETTPTDLELDINLIPKCILKFKDHGYDPCGNKNTLKFINQLNEKYGLYQ